MSIKILVADDESNICHVVQLYLEKEGFTVFTAADGEEALQIETTEQPDILILDVMLPKCSGWDICQSLQRKVPIIFLTAKHAEDDKMTAFSLGADDYITKPFSPRELVARVRAVLRRCGLLYGVGTTIDFPGLSISPSTHSVKREEEENILSPKELELLLFLARHPKVAFSRQQLLANVWGYDFEGADRTVDATINRLRHKIDTSVYAYIHTVWGIGYKFEVIAK
ncbi:transcriptional regulatory protein c terminal [Lucifera butyrica]|uniref:Transcriptional regulatory protein c terminal n=1 Tax=Lucifera butyrica TaxID=1351585 RepID=A0A498RB25_9FIRM|nr:response regulator transcription factor [Lucifera butyrica]VBB08205.1 transcriptional regulatory protein c terminal [Lucifera butyrica]